MENDDTDAKHGAADTPTVVPGRSPGGGGADETVVVSSRGEADATVVSGRPEPDATVVERPSADRPDPAVGRASTTRPTGATPPSRTIGRYEILAEVGSGAHGTVYRALDPTIRRVVALKVVQAEAEEFPGGAVPAGPGAFFEREAQAAGALLHPGIVTLYDAGRDGDRYYLAMEFIEGETFAAEIARAGRVPVERAVEVVAAVAEALDFAHERGVVHRDIKPANLMILPDRSVKVADFGIARLTTAAASSTMTAGMMLGTPSYMSPEQVEGEPVDGRSDLYSIGCVLYEAVTGRKPFRAETMRALLTQFLTADPPPPSQSESTIPKALDDVILRAIARDRERRYPRGRDLARDLRASLPSSTVPAAPAPQPWIRRIAVAIVLAGIVLAGVLGARLWFRAPTGYVVTMSDPVGAEVFVDGTLLGHTPDAFEVNEGSHEVEYRKDGYFPAQATITVQARSRVPVTLDLIPKTEDGR